jgi:hypothetical protein
MELRDTNAGPSRPIKSGVSEVVKSAGECRAVDLRTADLRADGQFIMRQRHWEGTNVARDIHSLKGYFLSGQWATAVATLGHSRG